jgi:hypothetical protein
LTGAAVAPCAAYQSRLTTADTKAAIAAGVALQSAHAGFEAQAYVAFAVRDALQISPGDGSIDAIVVATPFERLRYASYLAAFQGESLSAPAIRDAANPDALDFVVFAHSSAAEDQDFLHRFGSVSFRIAGVTLRPTSVSTFGPAEDFFNTPSGAREPRMLGYATFRFHVRSMQTKDANVASAKGALTIVDPYGRRYDLAIDLAKYR